MTTILIVDDNGTNRELLVSLLKNSEYRLLEARNGSEALELVRAERPALVITDILMPVMDGYEFARQVRADPELAGIPILFYSATYNQQEAHALARSAGVTYVLTKPAEPRAILNMIAAALGTGPGISQPRLDTKPLIDPVHVMSSKLSEKMGELGELSHRMAGLVELGLRVTLERDPEHLLQLVCDEAREIIGAKYSAIGLLAADGKTIRHFLTSGMDKEIIQHIGGLPVGKGLLGKLLTETRPFRIADISTDPDSVGFPASHPPMRSFLGAPIATPAIVYGRIYLTEKIGAEEFSEQDEQLAVALAAQVAVAYENAQLYNEIQHHASSLQLEVAERKKVQAALAESERKFRALVEHSSDGIVVQTLDGTVLYVSPAVEKITGIHTEVGERVNPFAHIHQDDVELSQQIWEQVIRFPLIQRVTQFRIHHPSGTWRWVEAIATNLVDEPSVGGIVINFADITERKEFQEEIESIANFPRESIAPVLRIARSGTLLYANPASKNLLTLWQCKVGGQPPDHVQHLVAETLMRGHSQEIEVTLGDVVDALILVPIPDKGYVNVYGRDITERKRAEEGIQRSKIELEQRVAERTAELHKTNTELEHANRTKDEFLANMSHELRTPLNSILGLSEILLEERCGVLNDYQQRSLKIIESSGHHLLDLINDILDLSKIEAGMLEFYPQPISVTEFCNSCLAFISAQAARKSISVTLTNEATNTKLFADPRRLKQILVNLLTNAVKFSLESGHVNLQVSYDPEEDLIRFSVIDDGIGISAENLKHLFHPFVQVDSSLNRQYEGTGLGLALVQKLTDLHGGSVSVQSEVGKGSCFTIHLPCHLDRLKELEQIQPVYVLSELPERKEVTPDVSIRRHLILLAEDQTANILTIGEYLDSHGFALVVAHDGLEAVEKAQATRPDLILMDIQMPVLDGLEAITCLRQNPDFAATPIIAVTALVMPGDRERCLEAGADEYMSKPVSLKSLRLVIEYLLKTQ